MKAAKLIKEPSEQNAASAISAVGTVAMLAPFPWGMAIGGVL